MVIRHENISHEAREHAAWRMACMVMKYHEGDKDPYEVVTVPGNLLLNEGINLLWDLALGSVGTAWNNANSRVGVGNGSAAVVATQTGLQGASTAFAPMAAGYPQRTNQSVDWQGTFGTGSANFSWEEWTIDNGAVSTINLNRRVVNLGTKVSTEIWVLTASCTLS